MGSVPFLHMARRQCCGAAPGLGCCTAAGPITPSHAHPSSPDPCHNGGSCSDGIGTFFCECLAGFRGPKCEEDINECASNPCKNGANCTDCVNSYTCTCPSGFSGIHCENNTPDCTERYSPASWDKGLRSLCLRSLCCPIALGWCVGPLGWGTSSGESLGCYVCVPSSCFNGGTCVDGINTFTCVCLPGFTGSYCEHNINECDSKPCLNGGTCQDSYGTYKCTCPQGYTGLNCQVWEAWVGAAVGSGGHCTPAGALLGPHTHLLLCSPRTWCVGVTPRPAKMEASAGRPATCTTASATAAGRGSTVMSPVCPVRWLLSSKVRPCRVYRARLGSPGVPCARH